MVQILLIIALFGAVVATEDWFLNGHFYQIYPRSYQDSNDDGVGDLKGITNKLDHLKYINVSGVWLSPIFKSPLKDFGYDISDFREIHAEYGTMEDFERMVARANELGIKIILDFVPNHSSDEHEWFKKSNNPNDPEFQKYKDYYIWNTGKVLENGTRVEPSNWNSVFGGRMWTWSENRQAYYLHQFLAAQPDLNFRNEAVKNEMNEIMRFWLRKGVGGFRVDAVPHIFEVDKNTDGFYPDEDKSGDCDDPDAFCYLDHSKTMHLQETYELIYDWRSVIDEPEFSNLTRILMAEAYGTLEKMQKYYGKTENGAIVEGRYGAHIPFNFLLMSTGTWTNAPEYKELIESWINGMPKGKNIQPNWVLGNHDNGRIATRYGPQRTDLVNILLKTLPGITVTYYGEEIGMTNVKIPDDNDERNPVRTPLQWDDSKNAGFSGAEKTWLPVAANYSICNIKLQKTKERSFLKVFRDLIRLRQSPTFKYGAFKINAIDDDLLVYKYQIEDNENADVIVVALNFRDSLKTVDLNSSLGVLPDKLTVVTASIHAEHINSGDLVNSIEVEIPGETGIVFIGRK